MTDPYEAFQYALDEQRRSIYTHVFARVETVDPETRRLEVALKDERAAKIDNVPVASPYTGDGFGEVYPIEPGDEGILAVLKDPIDDLVVSRGWIADAVSKHRQHELKDAIFYPRVFYDSDTVPRVEALLEGMVGATGPDLGEYRLEHKSGSWWRIGAPDAPGGGGNIDLVHHGDHYLQISDQHGIRARHASGHEIVVDETGVTFGGPDGPVFSTGTVATTAQDGDTHHKTQLRKSWTVPEPGTDPETNPEAVELTVNGTAVLAYDDQRLVAPERFKQTPQDVSQLTNPEPGDQVYHDGADGSTRGTYEYDAVDGAWVSLRDGTTILPP